MSKKKKLIVVGGGAAGFFCAVNAARLSKDLDVQILEKTSKILSKVKTSGGGRCNVTHAATEVSDLFHAYPRGKNFVRKTLYQFPPAKTIEWFRERGVELKVEADGRMFPVSDQSQTIVNCLLSEAEKYNVQIRIRQEVISIEPAGEHFKICIQSDQKSEEVLLADYICIAAGGHPKINGFSFLGRTGHTVVAPVPSLFTFNIADKDLHQLMGIAVPETLVKIPSLKLQEQGPVLITHWGLSGPAVLKLSARAARALHERNHQVDVSVNWIAPNHESSALESLKNYRQEARHEVSGKNPFGLTTRLWTYLVQKAGMNPAVKWTDVNNALLTRLSKLLTADLYHVNGKTTYKEEFVTAGGVSLNEIDPLTMESHICKSLYFAGEVVDVDGITGGYNFQHAWSSGWIAANSITSIHKNL
jgi:predicted Rossmann fold flavoprotein